MPAVNNKANPERKAKSMSVSGDNVWIIGRDDDLPYRLKRDAISHKDSWENHGEKKGLSISAGKGGSALMRGLDNKLYRWTDAANKWWPVPNVEGEVLGVYSIVDKVDESEHFYYWDSENDLYESHNDAKSEEDCLRAEIGELNARLEAQGCSKSGDDEAEELAKVKADLAAANAMIAR